MKEYLNGLQHIGVPVKNYEKSCRFYEQLGFENIYTTMQPSGGKVAFYQMGNLQMEIYEADVLSGKDGAIDHIALDCNDIDMAYQQVCDMGLTIVSNGIEELPYWEHGIRFFHVKGPDGEKIEFCQKKA